MAERDSGRAVPVRCRHRTDAAPALWGVGIGRGAKGACVMEISVVTPVFNEQDSREPFFGHLLPCLRALGKSFEIIAVNDGSHDKSQAILEALTARIPELTVVKFRRNFGQTAALMAGIDHAGGDVVVMLDSDLQNDPADIGAL